MNLHTKRGLYILMSCWLFVILALSPAGAVEKRVAIVYSETSMSKYWDEHGFNQLFMAMQYQTAMGGVPYDLLYESDLVSADALAGYDVLIAPFFEYVDSSIRPRIISSLSEASGNGLHIITSGYFLTRDQDGNIYSDYNEVLAELVGVAGAGFYGPVPADVVAADISHPAMRGYQADQVIRRYAELWTNIFALGSAADPAESSVLCEYSIEGNAEPAVLAVTTGSGRRNVHFANEQVMQDTNVLWSALQWSLYGDDTPVAMQLGRQRSLFFARNDMDISSSAEEVSTVHVPLLEIITDWKDKYGFVGSYYINIGNDPVNGLYTDWLVSGPLYHQYLNLGSEIGTHTYTHPHMTYELSAEELEFEFNQSALAIEQNLGIDVIGAAVPGMPETVFVQETVEPWLDYLSGRAAISGTDFGYAAAFGYIRPDFNMFYFCLNTSPDYTLVSWQGLSAAEAQQVWLDEYAGHLENASLPVIHWLWHDYGPVQYDAGYTQDMYEAMIAIAAAGDAEFVTGDDLMNRVKSLQAADLDVTRIDDTTQLVLVESSDAGRFALVLPEEDIVTSVDNWYAYDGNKVFLPRNGGTFTIHTGGSQTAVTRITRMPQRAELISLEGDGRELEFTFTGQGELELELNGTGDSLQISGADALIKDASGNSVTLYFRNNVEHAVSVFIPDSNANHAPIARSTTVETKQGEPVSFVLDAEDPEGNSLLYGYSADSDGGTLSGTGPYLTFAPEEGFSGQYTFHFSASDLYASSDAQVTINVAAVAVIVDGNLDEWSVIDPLAVDGADTEDTIDILKLYGRQVGDVIYLAFENDGLIGELNWGYTWYLDTDRDLTTGFGMYPIGADYVIQGNNLFRFNGSTSDEWLWTWVGTLDYAISEKSVELALDTSLINGATQFNLSFYGSNAAFGQSSVDLVPNAGYVSFGESLAEGEMPVDGNIEDWDEFEGDHYIRLSDVALSGSNPVDIEEVHVKFPADTSDMYAAFVNETSLSQLGWSYTLYLDTIPGQDAGFAIDTIMADYMIQDGILYTHSGETSEDWQWDVADSVTVALDGRVVELRVPLSSLGLTDTERDFGFVVVGENAAFGSSDGTDSVSGNTGDMIQDDTLDDSSEDTSDDWQWWDWWNDLFV